MILGGILIACICWALTFGLPWGNFWIKIGLSVIAVCLYSLVCQKPRVSLSVASCVWGIVSAALLYGIFFLGNALSPYILPAANTEVESIYALGTNTSRLLVFILLFFITGPGEEIFWRGFLQENLMRRLGRYSGFVLTSLVYAGVHVFSLNVMLIGAALTAGAFWGGLYLWKRDLWMVIVSHSAWSAFIFAVAPIR